MGRKTNRFLFFVLTLSALGVILGGTASYAQVNQCQNSNTPTSECLTQDPIVETLEGMSLGLFAGAGAAFGATWQLRQKDS